MVSLSVSFFSVKVSFGCMVFKYSSTIRTSQILVYLGKAGRFSKTPLRNLQTSGCVPKLVLSDKLTIDDSALLAVFSALYPSPFLNNSARKFIPSSTVGEKGLICR